MLKELKFVQGAVAKKDLLPAMTHFRIERGTVRSYNGRLALSSPINLDIECNPKATQLVNAISRCADDQPFSIAMTAGGRLSIKSGPARWYVETIEGETPHPEPAGEHVEFNGAAFLEACRTLEPFIGRDASRLWSNGILLKGMSAFATNNTTLVEFWLGVPVPFVANVPREAIKEVLRIGEAPTHAQLEPSSMTFHYTDGRWIRTQLLDTTWPDLTKLLDQPCTPRPVPAGLFEGLEKLKGASDGAGRVYIRDGVMRTHLDDGTGATYEVDLPFDGCYQIAMLGLLAGVVNTIDMSSYPGPCLFFGDRIRGAIIGMRM